MALLIYMIAFYMQAPFSINNSSMFWQQYALFFSVLMWCTTSLG